jgi:hypothetical protein
MEPVWEPQALLGVVAAQAPHWVYAGREPSLLLNKTPMAPKPSPTSLKKPSEGVTTWPLFFFFYLPVSPIIKEYVLDEGNTCGSRL